MPIEVVMPRLGWTMTEGTLAEWLKASGEQIQAGDALFTVESDKALSEIESFDGGILHIPDNAPAPGDIIPIGAVLGYLLAEGEPGPAAVPPPPAVDAAWEAEPSVPAPESTSRVQGDRPAISPRARRLAKELSVEWEQISGTGSTGRITEGDIRAAAGGDPAQPSGAAPAAGSGDNDPQVALPEGSRRNPMNPIRRAISDRLSASHREGAPVTLTAELDATDLVELRQAARPRPAFNDYLIRFAATALERHPALNSSISGNDIVLHGLIHIGFAVDTEAGLVVPVVRDAHGKSVEEIARESAHLSGRALRGELTSEEMTGGTFTITNLGAAGIDAFTPIVNPPQCAILGVGRIAQRPAVYEGQVVPRWLCVVSLSFDHRIVDGGPAARFLATLRELVESPVPAA
ncbi:MAG: 2-oxo acid dehydrogenase subunit E2 [Gemmatimonadetes bacterium]|nr:2-oxo acid dehydrogenase subunit E2 [Gemmatimonadota bacterium]